MFGEKGFSATSIRDWYGWRTTRSMLAWDSPPAFSSAEGALVYLAGNTVVALLSAAIAYLLAVRAVRFYRREKEKRRKHGNVGE